VYLSEVLTHVKLKTTKKPLTTNKQAKQGKQKKKKNDRRSNQDAISCWKQFLYGMVINMYGVVRSLLSRCLRVWGAQDHRKAQGAREKNKRGHACLTLRKIRTVLWPVKCLYEINEHFTENTLEAPREKASELSDNTLTSKQALVCSGPLSLCIRIWFSWEDFRSRICACENDNQLIYISFSELLKTLCSQSQSYIAHIIYRFSHS